VEVKKITLTDTVPTGALKNLSHTPPAEPQVSSNGSGTSSALPKLVPLDSSGGSKSPVATATSFKNAETTHDAEDALFNNIPYSGKLPFTMPNNPIPNTSQSVTYSTRAIDNVSDIMDALNISASMSIKYGTIHGNGNASFVNENKVLDSQLNYVVSVQVNNNTYQTSVDEMEFQPIDNIPATQFSEVYGDSFISGFVEGGVFSAIISIDVHDKSKLRHVKQAVDVALAVGPSPVSVGGGESFDKQHQELLQDTEISISVNWTGGGEIKNPDVPWTVSSVVAVANAFPSMVAHCSAKTAAILSRYTSLRTFQAWKYKMMIEDPKEPLWGEQNLILNYAPVRVPLVCTGYN
jgi:hypothetical protein